MSFGETPVALRMASSVRSRSRATAASVMPDKTLCDQEWFPISWPSSTMRFATDGWSATRWPTQKNVAFMPRSLSIFKRRTVFSGCGPSSNVSAM